MKSFRLLASVSLLAAVWSITGCTASPMSRIDSNRSAYESWPLEVQEAVLNGRAIKGMTPAQVEMSLGKPSQVISRSGKNGDDEIWVYKKGATTSNLLRNSGLSIGTNIGGVGVGTGVPLGGGRNRSVAGDEQEVVFERGVVLRADAGN